MLAPRRYRFGEFTLDLKRGALFRGPAEVRLRPKSFAVLQALVERHGELVTKEELLGRVWGRTVVTDGVITQCLIDVRRAIGDDAQGVVRTVPRRGYLFTAPVITADDEPPPEAAPILEAQVPPTHDPPATPSPEPVPQGFAGSGRALAVILLLALLGALMWSGLASRPEATSAPAAPGQLGDDRRSIAVLPFVNLTGDPDGEYIADGIAEEVLHLLVQGDGLRVIARTSSFAFKGQPTTGIQDIAAKLDVDYVIEGSVRRAGANLRVNAQLIDASTNSQVWSKAYERDVRDLLEVQQDIAEHIATALRTSLGDRRHAASHVADPAAHNAFLRGRFFFNRRLPGDMEKAEHAYQEALRLDPRFARAWAGLAGVYGVFIGEPGADVAALLQKQREAIDAAIALDPDLAEARIRGARYYFQIGDQARASREAAIARELAPEDPAVLWWSSNELAWQGRLDQAIEIQRRVVASDPLSRVPRVNLANTLLAAGRLEEARAEFLRFEEMGARPEPAVAVDLARIDLLAGRHAEAMAETARWQAGPDRDFVLAVAGDALGQRDLARAAESRLLAGTGPAEAVRLAELYAHRSDRDAAFRWLHVAHERLGPSPWLTADWEWTYHLRFSPFLRPLHTDDRWPL